MTAKYNFRLYIVTNSPLGQKAQTNLLKFLEQNKDPTEYNYEVIDVIEKPNLATNDEVVATPTLVIVTPSKTTRIIGDLSNTKSIRDALEKN